MTLIWRCDKCGVESGKGATKIPTGWMPYLIEKKNGETKMLHRCRKCRTGGKVEQPAPKRKRKKEKKEPQVDPDTGQGSLL